ncbi:MAG: tRNA (adenosine(37)-N6)-threonylcarbamoyltransferase complex ATPase subunit type 1 TsaE [Candidatus Riflebacteria bacterium]|nr:tRNA (adenosine(37)-N6)-threonylcarbamoyltransferase complex ATPase subunit type 1 TsaE [Candidatus Riflebacteria bacterium]
MEAKSGIRVTFSPEETKTVAAELALLIKTPLVLMRGNLGSGKTVFATGFAEGLGIKAFVSSPSYTIMNEYRDNEKTMYHLDLYRIDSLEEVVDIGLYDIIKQNIPCVVEWSEKLKELETLPHLSVTIDSCPDSKENCRIISWKAKEA